MLPVTVKYAFIRSDGVTGPVQTITLTKQGAQTVTSTWHIGGSGFSTSGWQALKIISPDPKESRKADSALNCNNDKYPPCDVVYEKTGIRSAA